ncbi:MAG: hypothetical protein WBA73_07465 [Devosia sp.]
MANATNSGRMAACNPVSPSINTAPVGDPGPVHPGLVEHPLLSPTVQVQILSVVDLTGSASVGNIIAELPNHTDPVGAVIALTTAGALEVRSAGFIDANSVVARPGDCLLKTGSDVHGTTPAAGQVDLPEAAVEPATMSRDTAELCVDALPPDLSAVPVGPLQPRIIIGPGERRTAFGRVDCLQRPGVYIVLRGRDAYIGYGAEAGFRITDGRQLPGGTPDCIIAIVDEHNGLSINDAKALERILWSSVAADADFVPYNGVPDGSALEPARYDQLALFSAQAVLALRHAGLMFVSGSVREHIAGPIAEPDRLGPSRGIDEPPEGRITEMSYRGLTALAAERDDGTWLLLGGSEVRIDTTSSATASATFQRAAWRYSGLLEPAGNGACYTLKRDLVFASGRAVSHFVSGSKSLGLSAWQPIDELDDSDVPGPAL